MLHSSGAGVGLTLFLAVVVYFPSKPPTPPSPTAHIDRFDFRDSVGKMMRCASCLDQCPQLLSPGPWSTTGRCNVVGLTGVLVSGTIGLVVGRLTDLVYGYVKFTLILFMMGNMACFYWFFLLSWGTIPATLWQIYGSVVGGLSLNFACSPLFFELALEISYPCSEVIVGGLVTGMNNLVGLSFLFIFFIPNIGYAWVTYVLVGASAVSILPVLFVKEDYNSNASTPLVPLDNHAPPRYTTTPASQCYARATNATTPLVPTDNFMAPLRTTTRTSDHNTSIKTLVE
ncbi:hypothetical protein Pcinc_016102 [Petrolisthes cinctipes]|uniref:Uncharacterized protein n=1 Tax=Petrolisthes cinctipes TaxID=88211 RepID=A0AAE1FUB9_PETCI|nr:hypothetical protein Pcinc_016102 [Petrolisthes cinctipes]